MAGSERVHEVSPREDGLVRDALQDLFLQTDKRVAAFSIDGGHEDSEDAHERVRFVLDPRGLAGARPRHSPRNTDRVERCAMQKNVNVNSGNLFDHRSQGAPHPDHPPVLRQEDDLDGGDELLERPPPREPGTPAKLGPISPWVCAVIHVVKERVADVRAGVPFVHRVDGFGEFRAARLVDAAHICPGEAVAVRPSEGAETPELLGEPLVLPDGYWYLRTNILDSRRFFKPTFLVNPLDVLCIYSLVN